MWLDLIQCKTEEKGWIFRLKKHFFSQPDNFKSCYTEKKGHKSRSRAWEEMFYAVD